MNKQVFPDLHKSSGGKTMVWRVWVIDDKLYNTFGFEGGKMREPSVREFKGTNIGKKNEKSPHEHAKSEATKRWNDQIIKNGYSENNANTTSIEEIPIREVIPSETSRGVIPRELSRGVMPSRGIMKAHVYEDHKSKIKWDEGVYIQRKYDGVRCIGTADDITSSSEKPFKFLSHIKEALRECLVGEFKDLMVDGECYAHTIYDEDGNEISPEDRFNIITGACRSVRTTPHPLESQMKYYIFDVCTKDKQSVRFELLDKLFNYINTTKYNSILIKVETSIIHSETEMKDMCNLFIQQEYEGCMVRNKNGLYTHSKRNYDIQKYKLFHDKEFPIVGYTQSAGTEVGGVLWKCAVDGGGEGVVFDVRPRGTLVMKRWWYINGKSFIGKMLTVRYQSLSEDGVPRFPVGIAIRDYE